MTRVIQYTADALSAGSLYALYACGLSLMLSVARIANFAYGDLVMVGSYALLVSRALPWPLVIALVVIAATTLNVVVDRVAFRRLRGADGMTLLVASLGASILIQNLMILAAGARPESVNFGATLNSAVRLGGIAVPGIDLVTVAAALVVLALLALFLRRTLVGMQLRAAAEDFTMSRMLGVRANRVIATAFAISGAIAGVAATLLTIQSGSLSTDLGLQPTLIAFVAVVIGGLGSLGGATLAGMLLGIVSVILQAALPASLLPYHDAILFSLIIFMLLGRPQGLFGTRAAGVRI
jgi:branched-chain amino acid transport system permease protein